MRPNQNRRMRGRNRPKGPNPLTRSYESNGPDVKIRGTAQHIADKYAQLARDALASGDPIAAENYFQHGEHYFRIITSAQEPTRQASAQGYARNAFDDEDEGDEEAMQGGGNGEQGRQGYATDEYGDPGHQPQPYERHDYDNRQSRNDRNDRNDRRDRFQNRNDRQQRYDNNRQDNNRPDYGRDQRSDQRGDYGRQDYGNRQDSNRQDSNRQDRGRSDYRQDYNRQDVGRQDAGRQDGGRQEQGRQEHSRQEPGRHDNRYEGRAEQGRDDSRNEQPRSEEFVRRDRRDEPSRAVSEDNSGLPAFLMTATRNPVASEPAAEDEAPRRRQAAEPDSDVANATESGETAVRKPRRRRARYKAGEGPDGAQEAATENNEPAEASSAAE